MTRSRRRLRNYVLKAWPAITCALPVMTVHRNTWAVSSTMLDGQWSWMSSVGPGQNTSRCVMVRIAGGRRPMMRRAECMATRRVEISAVEAPQRATGGKRDLGLGIWDLASWASRRGILGVVLRWCHASSILGFCLTRLELHAALIDGPVEPCGVARASGFFETIWVRWTTDDTEWEAE